MNIYLSAILGVCLVKHLIINQSINQLSGKEYRYSKIGHCGATTTDKMLGNKNMLTKTTKS